MGPRRCAAARHQRPSRLRRPSRRRPGRRGRQRANLCASLRLSRLDRAPLPREFCALLLGQNYGFRMAFWGSSFAAAARSVRRRAARAPRLRNFPAPDLKRSARRSRLFRLVFFHSHRDRSGSDRPHFRRALTRPGRRLPRKVPERRDRRASRPMTDGHGYIRLPAQTAAPRRIIAKGAPVTIAGGAVQGLRRAVPGHVEAGPRVGAARSCSAGKPPSKSPPRWSFQGSNERSRGFARWAESLSRALRWTATKVFGLKATSLGSV